MTYSFLEQICQPVVDLANDWEESVPFNVLAAAFSLKFFLSQMFSMNYRESLGSTETEEMLRCLKISRNCFYRKLAL